MQWLKLFLFFFKKSLYKGNKSCILLVDVSNNANENRGALPMKDSTISILNQAGYENCNIADFPITAGFIAKQAEFAAEVRAAQYNGYKIESQGVWFQDGRVGLRYYDKQLNLQFAELIDCSAFAGWKFGSKLDYDEAMRK
jgi:hypothetical protein